MKMSKQWKLYRFEKSRKLFFQPIRNSSKIRAKAVARALANTRKLTGMWPLQGHKAMWNFAGPYLGLSRGLSKALLDTQTDSS